MEIVELRKEGAICQILMNCILRQRRSWRLIVHGKRKGPSELCQAVRRKMFVMFIVYHMQGGFFNEVFAAFPGEFPGNKTNGH